MPYRKLFSIELFFYKNIFLQLAAPCHAPDIRTVKNGLPRKAKRDSRAKRAPNSNNDFTLEIPHAEILIKNKTLGLKERLLPREILPADKVTEFP